MVFEIGGSSSSLSKKNSSDDHMVSNNENLSVLVVDDDPLFRMMNNARLKKFGLKPQVVENGKKAVDLCRSGTSFDLILMDKEMPIMDGVEATKELRALGVNSMIVGITSHGLPERQAFKEAGLDYCFEKPLNSEIVTFLLEELNNNNKKKNNNN